MGLDIVSRIPSCYYGNPERTFRNMDLQYKDTSVFQYSLIRICLNLMMYLQFNYKEESYSAISSYPPKCHFKYRFLQLTYEFLSYLHDIA